jgi:hypothetical protein
MMNAGGAASAAIGEPARHPARIHPNISHRDFSADRAG